jgi:Tax1-binding protein 3
VTSIRPDGPSFDSDLRIHDKILQVNGYDLTLVTHKKAVEYIQKGKSLNLLVTRNYKPNN